ncbi:cytochrome P450 [Streptomyces yaanensis]|uniref:Cytochrome P450 n=1 Tax=Streptomyces yaanensis TaxID=1142239 RepID=A0ABV7S9I3_9ACTN|nr:cytochrome P450 [Streptomyces sp. CGMCC 4.7035]WNC03165.1 cytochrome P450 [Streptomyces sp. CGMCC 4.7035]
MSGVEPQPERAWTVGNAPGIFPFVGHGITLFRRPLAFLNSLPAHGDLVEIRLGLQRAWLACHPELVHRILMDTRTFDKGGPQYDRLRPLMGGGLVTCGHEEHRRQRRLIQPTFRPSRITDYTRVMAEEAEAVFRDWRPGEKVDVSAAMLALTTRVTSRVLLSDALDAATVAEVRDCLAALVRGLFIRTVMPLAPLFRIPTPANRRYRRAFVRFHAIIDAAVDERRRGSPRDDLLGTLLAAEADHAGGDHRGAAVTGQEIHDQLITLLLTGVESTAMCLGSVFSLLPRHPEVESRLHSEVDVLLAGGRRPGPQELSRLVYTRCLITETLRVYPPGWLFTRITTRETDLAGLRLPRGATVLYSPYLLHHDPASFPDPDRFLPERWLPGRATAVPSGAMLPFAAGGRKCIGDTFALAEATLAVATIASRWRLRPLPGHVEQPRPAATLGPRSLEMICEQRRSPASAGEAAAQAPCIPGKDPSCPAQSSPAPRAEVTCGLRESPSRSEQNSLTTGIRATPRKRDCRREGDKGADDA